MFSLSTVSILWVCLSAVISEVINLLMATSAHLIQCFLFDVFVEFSHSILACMAVLASLTEVVLVLDTW